MTHVETNKHAKKPLIDPYNRTISYLRLSVTDRCNLRCTYCMAEKMQFLPRQKLLTLEEIRDVGKAFVTLGINKIRLTGGEPLVRRGIIGLVGSLASEEGLDELTMTTNGLLLEKKAKDLKLAGLGRLNISVDSLIPEKFRQLTRFGDIKDWHKGINAAKEAQFSNIKLNVVVLKGFNDLEICDLAEYAIANEFDISFIEEMPLGVTKSHDRVQTQVCCGDIKQQLSQKFELIETLERTGGPSRYMRVAGTKSKIGFISPISENFCGACNRVRVTADGRLLLCLGNENSIDLKSIIRNHPGDQNMLNEAIRGAIQNKPERHYFDPSRTDILRFMNTTGG